MPGGEAVHVDLDGRQLERPLPGVQDVGVDRSVELDDHRAVGDAGQRTQTLQALVARAHAAAGDQTIPEQVGHVVVVLQPDALSGADGGVGPDGWCDVPDR
jgi:hypothetical protein